MLIFSQRFNEPKEVSLSGTTTAVFMVKIDGDGVRQS